MAEISGFGALCFSLSAVEKLRLASASKCLMYFDRARRKLGFQLIPDAPEEGWDYVEPTFPMPEICKIHVRTDLAVIMIGRILKRNGIEFVENAAYPVKTERCNGMTLIAVDLSRPIRCFGVSGGIPNYCAIPAYRENNA